MQDSLHSLHAMPETLIAVHTQGCTYYFEASQQDSESVYGGPLKQSLSGIATGQAPLQHIATLSQAQLPMLKNGDLPLLYGFQYSGCELDYQYSADAVDVQSLSPHESTDGWPYDDYPALIPRLMLKLSKVQVESWQVFSARYPNLPAQQAAELVVITPPPLNIGHSLWGEDGDAEEVCVVCECDLTHKTARSYNICS